MVKQQLFDKIIRMLNERIASIQGVIKAAIESRDNETKSSVGDKYETGRTLMQQEIEKNRALLNKTERLINELNQINLNTKFEEVKFGSFVETNQGNYFISSALGKIDVEGESCFCISLMSPIGNVLSNKKAGETVSFQNREIKIIQVY
ncbi:3-oxoacyl-ACP synthase [Puteibacter caeruleilacunae]|nr:3-oxoacyl-ACP synthase [Puteibacter caeruleilacunae]